MSRRARWATFAIGLAGALSAAGPSSGAAVPPPPTQLRVDERTGIWNPDTQFHLEWHNPTDLDPTLVAARYRVKAPSGTVVAQGRLGFLAAAAYVSVPRVPGVYSGEVWLEDADGSQGPAAATQLRFDDVAPGAAGPIAPPGWLGRNSFPLTLRIAQPPEPLPISGIRGYAVSVTREAGGAPCPASVCLAAETDLSGGIGNDELEIPALPDGLNYVHSVAVSGSGVRSAAVGHALLRVDTVDPETRLLGLPSSWAPGPVALTAESADAGSGMGKGEGAYTAMRVDGNSPVTAPGARVGTTVIGEGVHTVAYYARDVAGNSDDGASSNGHRNRQPRTAVVRIDQTEPRAAFANSQDPRDPELIRVLVSDGLSGASSTIGSIGVRRAGSGDSFASLPSWTEGDELRARWPAEDYERGTYEFSATPYDAAGNSSTSTARANGSRMLLESPLKSATSIEAGFLAPGATIAFGRRVRYAGRLSTATGKPIAGGAVEVVERTKGRAVARIFTVPTSADGRFSLRLPKGPSREVSAHFAGDRVNSRSSSGSAKLGVRGGIEMRASSAVAAIGGPPVLFSGRVMGKPGELPGGGKSIELQFRAPGLGWQEFRTVETDRRGRFRYAYRFSDDDSRGVRFEFRAHAAAQSGWPYEPGDSRPVAVRGR